MAAHTNLRTYFHDAARWRRQFVRTVVRHHCSCAGIPPVAFGQYCGFAWELDRHGQPWCHRVDVRAAAHVLVGKWAERGLDPEMLKKLVYALTNYKLDGPANKSETRYPNDESSPKGEQEKP